MWDDACWHAIESRQLQYCRDAGLLSQLVIYLDGVANLHVFCGDFAAAASLVAEARSIAAATGTWFVPYGAVLLAGYRGAEAEAAHLIETGAADARAAGHGGGIQQSQWVSAILHNGLGRYETALTQAQQASEQAPELFISMWALPELVEAASRTGQTRLAAGALARLAETTSVAQTDWGTGIYARCHALLSDGQDAEDLYREAIGRLGRTLLRPELARAHLLYGEWLRRESRRVDGRAQLRIALEMLDAIGMNAFAARARRELTATGEKVRKRSSGTREELTPQEEQIARLARAGLSNPEIGTQLFLSARTVEWHLRKVFTKLGIGSRHELKEALGQRGRSTGRPS
jgi:DNA-binding CsgD family transcriptional regulator